MGDKISGQKKWYDSYLPLTNLVETTGMTFIFFVVH